MIIDIMLHAPDRATFITGMISRGFMISTIQPDGSTINSPAPDIAIDEIGDVVDIPATFKPDGTILTPATMISGFHANIRCYGAFAEQITKGLPQVDNSGAPLSIFDRTYFLHLLPDFTSWIPTLTNGVPKGWQGPDGTRLYDPSWVISPTRVWA